MKSVQYIFLLIIATSVYVVYADERDDNPYVQCVDSQAIKNTNQCLEKTGRIDWYPYSSGDCGITKEFLRMADNNGHVLSWRLLFQNERCRRLGEKYYERVPANELTNNTQLDNSRIIKKSGAILRVPKRWVEVEPDNPNTVIKVFDEYGALSDCNVVFTRNDIFSQYSSNELAEAKLRSEPKLPYEIIKRYIRNVSGIPAYTVHFKFDTEILPQVPLKMSGIQSGIFKNDRYYTLTCRYLNNDLKSHNLINEIIDEFRVN